VNKKAIGGYFELELPYNKEFHTEVIRLNSGRNAFEYILRAKEIKKVHLPFYTCDVMLEPLEKLGLSYEFYAIDKAFYPLFNFNKIKEREAFVYTNYFGLCEKQVNDLASRIEYLIVDNSQAFYSKRLPGVDTFYSPRKFFGIPDGAYLYTNQYLQEDLEVDVSYQRFEHLLGRIDIDAESFYSSFIESDNSLINQPIKQMSQLTQRLLYSINYEEVARQRKENFEILHSFLGSSNKLRLDISQSSTPMIYPYLLDGGKELKQELIKNKIYVATYWPSVLNWTAEESFEYKLAENLLALPVDQRYDISDMKYIISIIKRHA